MTRRRGFVGFVPVTADRVAVAHATAAQLSRLEAEREAAAARLEQDRRAAAERARQQRQAAASRPKPPGPAPTPVSAPARLTRADLPSLPLDAVAVVRRIADGALFARHRDGRLTPLPRKEKP